MDKVTIQKSVSIGVTDVNHRKKMRDDAPKVVFDVPKGMEKIVINYRLSNKKTSVYVGLMHNDRWLGWNETSTHTIEMSTTYASLNLEHVTDLSGEWKILINTERASEYSEVFFDIELVPAESRWLRGDTHMHTTFSDGRLGFYQLIHRAESLNYDYVFLTDHNTVLQNYEALKCNTHLCLIPGLEFTTKGRGHANFMGKLDPIPNLPTDMHGTKLLPKDDNELIKIIEMARNNGAYIGINHPFGNWAWNLPWDDCDWIEIINEDWLKTTIDNGKAFEYWINFLKQGRRVSAISGIDFHGHGDALGLDSLPATYVYAIKDPESILQAIKKGHAYIQSDDSVLHKFELDDGSIMGDIGKGSKVHIKLTTHPDNKVYLYKNDEIITLQHNGNVDQIIDFKEKGFILLRVDGPEKAELITNPIYK